MPTTTTPIQSAFDDLIQELFPQGVDLDTYFHLQRAFFAGAMSCYMELDKASNGPANEYVRFVAIVHDELRNFAMKAQRNES